MTVFVLDCSVTMVWCFRDEAQDAADRLQDALVEDDAVVPPIWPFEVANTLLTGEKRARLSAETSMAFLEFLDMMPIRVAVEPPVGDIVHLGRDLGITGYDAAYLELAMREDLPLGTFDRKRARAARSIGVTVVA